MIKKLLMMFVVTMAATGAWAAFQCEIQVPAGDVGVSRTATVMYFNDGTSAIAAPYVRIEAGDNAYIRFSETDAWSKSVEFLATSDQLPASSLRAGETVEIPVFVYTVTQEAQMTLSYTQSSTEAFPWSDIGASLKPSYVSDSAWTFALATLKSHFGTTWNSYLSRLRANADYLAENGRPVRRVDRLLQIEINHALGVDAVLPVLASVTDAARSARGMGLSFTRSYSSAMYGHFTSGILGYGWTDNLSTYAELSSDGKTLVFRVPGGGSYSFTKATGSWKPEDSRDKTVLAESSSAYTLTYQSGTVQTFAKSNMRTSSIADNSGNTLTFTWNGTTLWKLAHTDGQTLTFAYSGGLISSVTDDCGRRTTYTYANSLLTKVTASDGLETLYEYRSADGTAAARALSRIIYPDGTTREFAYDTSSGLVTAISSNGGKETTTISRDGGVVTLTGPDGAETAVKTGVSGEVLKTTDALGGVSTKGYTADGLLKSVVSPSGLNGKIEHDALGRVSKSVSAAGTATAFAYEETFGNLKTVTDAKSHAVTYGYDAKGRGTSVTFADGSASKLEYNSRGDVVKSTNRRGQTVTYAYDAKGRVTKKTWSNGRTFTYAYDTHGNVTTATDSETGTVTMQYDSADRLTKIVYPAGRGFTFSYDSCGRLAVRTSLDGAVERFAYDASGRLASVSDGNGVTYLQNTYDETTGRLTRQVNGNGTSVSYLYDKLGRVVSIEHCDADGKIVESLQYCYDADGRCIRASSLFGEERYGYDNDGQLTSVEYPDDTEEAFVYDAVGNRASRTGGSPVQNETYTVNNLNQYTEIVNAQAARSTMTYDKDGNMTSFTDADGTTSNYYDTVNRLVAVTNTTKNIRWSCTYDVFGNRVSVTDNGVTTERTYLQGALPSVAAEYVNGELKERHIVVGAVRVADLITNHSSLTTKYYHADLIGSTRLVSDGNGAIVDRRAYKAFGETRLGGSSSSTTATAGYVGTLGVETDSTGLLFMRNRYYSPSLGRFIQMDPIGLDGEDVNLYRYCGNVSLQLVDIDGCTSLGATIVNFSNFVGNDVFGGNGVLNFQDLVVDKTVDLAADNYGKLIENKARLFGKGSRGAFKRAKIVSGNIGQIGFIYDISTFSSEFLITLAAQGIDGAAKVSRQFFLEMALSPGVMIGEIAFQIFGDKGGHVNGSMLTDINNKIAEQMISEFNYTINIDIGPGSGGGSGGGGSGGGGGAIMNESDWLDIATNKNAKTATYSLGADITFLNPKSIISEFKGTFVGNGFKITVGTGKSIFSTANGANFTGAFSSDGALVGQARNCIFDGCVVTGTLTVGGPNKKTGGLAHWASDCTFKDCSAFGKIISTEGNVGGLVGEAEKCSFENCSSSATVTGAYFVGGIAGKTSDCTFSMSRAVGIITAAGWSGGFVGDAIGCTFTKCRASGSVVGQPSLANNSSSYSGRIGGFVGYAEDACSFTDCYSTATVNAPEDDSAGGFVGHVDGDSSVVTFKRCYATGSVTGKTDVGGFIGIPSGCSLEDCYSKSTTIAVGETLSGGITKAQVGGFFGNVGINPASLVRCYALGRVSAPSSSGAVSWIYAGGFSWYQDYITSAHFPDMVCTDCYWDASGTGQSKSIFGKSLSASQINSKIASVSWYVDSQSQNASAASVRTAAYMSTQYKGLEESGVYTAEEPPVHSQGVSTDGDSPLVSAISTRAVLSRATATTPRIYCYERYVAVVDYEYDFFLSAEEDASITVAGLPEGLSFSNGFIFGTPKQAGVFSMAVTVRSSNGTLTNFVPFVITSEPADWSEEPFVKIVEFDPNGGFVSENSRRCRYNKVIGEMPEPTKEGCVFLGWYDSLDGGKIITETTVIRDGCTVFAHWKDIPDSIVFSKDALRAEEGENVTFTVSGGAEDKVSSVKLYLAYNTTSAADIDFANGLVWNVGAAVHYQTGLKFPLTLTWAAGEIGEKTITIPIKADKAIEDAEQFTLQLADPVGMELGEARLCTVTITDPGYAELEAKIAAGAATKAEQTAWDKLQKAKALYIRGVADPANAGKVTGSGLCALGKKVTLKATANKGYVITGWLKEQIALDGDRLVTNAVEYVATTPSLVIDRTTKPAKDTATSTTLTNVNDNATFYATFITVDEDKAAVGLTMNGGEMRRVEDNAPYQTNIMCGVALNWPLASSALSQTTVKVAGLPAGLKFTAKDIMKKGSKTEVEIPANTIYGAPTAASKIDKKTGLPVPSAVKVTVTTAGKSSVTYLMNITVDALPAWAVGNFEGFVSLDENDGGLATMSVTAAGKISGKIAYGGTNWTFKADSFAIASETVGYTNLALRTVATSGKAALNLSLNMVDFLVDSLPSSTTSFAEGYFGEVYTMMYRLPWKDKNDADAASLIASYAGAYSCKVPYGDDSGDVTFVLDEKGAVKGTVILPDGAKTRKATFSCNVLPNYDSLSVVIALPPDAKKGYPAVFKVVNLVNHSGEGADNLAFRDPGVVAAVAELTAESGAIGTVSVNPKYGQVAPGKDVTLTAKAAKGSVFHRWEITGVDTEGLDLSSSTLKIKMTDTGDVFAKAVFVTAEEDAASIALSVDALGGEISPEAFISVTNTCGVSLKWSVAADALSKPTVAVSGLPAGLKFTAKDIMKKGSKTEVDIPANTIYGAPTAESKLDAKTGLRKPSAVKFTVTTAGKSKRVYSVDMTILPLPDWAVGNFEGFVRYDENDGGFATMNITAAGKVSGKIAYGGTNWTFKADSYDITSETIGSTNFVVETVAVSDKAARKLWMTITDIGCDYLSHSAVAFVDGNFGDMPAEMHRLPWKDKDDAKSAALIASYAGAYSCKVPYGRDAASVTFVLDEKGAVKGTVVLPDGDKTRKTTFSCNVLPNYDSFSVVIALPPDLKKDYPAVFKIVELVNCSGEGSDGMAYRDPGVIVNVDEYFIGSGATGTVSVSPKYGQVSSGNSVTVTAKPDKGSVFRCWEIEGADTDGLNLTSPTLKFVMTGVKDVYATAVFATVKDDIASFSFSVPNRVMMPDEKLSIDLQDYVFSLSQPKFTVSGLPVGLKYDAKTMTISGAIAKKGTYAVMVTATNASATGKNAIVCEFIIKVQEPEPYNGYAPVSDFEWVYTSCGVEITKYLGEDSNVKIPFVVDNLPVVSIGKSAFRYSKTLTSVTIPDGVASIGSSAFYGCAYLEHVSIADSVTSIGIAAFDDCPNLESINIPKGVSVIEGCLFSKCYSLKSIVIPEGVTSIGESAFYHCNSLTELVIPNSVTNIDSGAFAYCSSLTNVIREGNGAISVGGGAFADCPGLINDDEFFIVMDVLCGYFGEGGDVVIPEGVTSIAENVFFWCDSLTSVTIPDSVAVIGSGAFKECPGLADEDGFVIVKGILFDYFGEGGNVVIPQGVVKIDSGAFEREDGPVEIKNIVIPESVTSIEEYAFESSLLTEIVFLGNAPILCGDVFYDVNENCTAYVRPGSIGWGVTIPGVWNNIYITYEALR